MPIRVPDNLREQLDLQLASSLRDGLRDAIHSAEALGVPCYLVGGPVRDLLLDEPIEDLDLVLEGDAIAVAEHFAAAVGGTLTRHHAFGTANVAMEARGGAYHIDFVTARAEKYPEPAVLPVVRPSTIADDLRRRDFTINTLALRLSSHEAFTLIDLCGGLQDLERQTIRVLHDASFVDDPTRTLRAARFAARLGFVIDVETRRLIADAAGAGLIERTSPARILHELWLTLAEPMPAAVLDVLHSLGVLPHLLPGLVWTPDVAELISEGCSRVTQEAERRRVLLGLLAWVIPGPMRGLLLDHYQIPTQERRVVEELEPLAAAIEQIEQNNLPPSRLYALLHLLSDDTRAIGELVAPDRARQALLNYQHFLHDTRPLLTGDDLRAMGLAPGPRFRVLLGGLLAAQLDGEVQTRAAAETWVRLQMANDA